MNLSVGFDRILAEAGKYKLVLAGLANQYVGQLSLPVRQAVFGNVGSFVVSRLGVDDAHIVQKELGVFTAEEILNLELGQAIAHAGGSNTAFNLRTYSEPPLLPADPTVEIVTLPHKLQEKRYVLDGVLMTDQNVKKAIVQVRQYCDDAPVPIKYAIATNGYTWIVFRAVRDDIGWKKGRARVFRSIEYLRDNFTEFWNLLSYARIVSTL